MFIKSIAIWFFGIALFFTLYVSSTMNAINDAYFVGIDDFKTPFYLVRLALIVGLIIATVLSVAVRTFRENGFPLGRSLGITAVIVPLVVWAFGFMPCMHEYALPRSLEKVVAHSLLCPEYSNRSYVWQVLAIICGALSYFSANKWKLKRS